MRRSQGLPISDGPMRFCWLRGWWWILWRMAAMRASRASVIVVLARQRLEGLPHRAVVVLVPAVHRAAARIVRAAVVLRCAVRSALCRLPAWARAIDDYLALTHRTHPAVRAPAADIRGLSWHGRPSGPAPPRCAGPVMRPHHRQP